MNAINIILEEKRTTPGFQFIEIESDEGHSVRVGTWKCKGSGMWNVRITSEDIEKAVKRHD